jgi:hypothetical protein
MNFYARKRQRVGIVDVLAGRRLQGPEEARDASTANKLASGRARVGVAPSQTLGSHSFRVSSLLARQALRTGKNTPLTS